MRKIFVTSIDGEKIVLEGDDHAHLAYALRSRIGDKVTVCCDKIDYECVIENITKHQTTLLVVSYQTVESEPIVDVTLFPAILKGDKMELVVQKCTELGVNTIIPFVSKNCECRVQAVRIERLNKISMEAAKQCGRGYVPPVLEVVDFAKVVEMLKEFDLIVFPYEKATKPSLKEYLMDKNAKKVAIIVGSEGGFAENEAKMLIDAGAIPVTLGKRIMRAETASIAVLSALMYQMGEWGDLV